MGYIKKLKNNELVGGTDKHTVYPVTSTKAVFEEVSENNFQSQEYLNNHIYGGEGGRINEESITDYNIAVGTVTKGKLTPQVQTMLDEGQKKALTPKGNYNSETEYEALDLVFDPVTNSSYISLVTPNVGHPVDENAEGYEEGWWEKTLDGTAVNTAQAAIDAKVGQLETQVGTAITQAEIAVDEAKQETLNAYTQAEALAQQITDWSSSEISSTPSYTDQHPLSNRASSAQVGYFECGTSSATQASNQIKAVTAGGYALPTSGGAVKIKMYAANTYTPTTNNPVKLQFNADATTLKELRYNNEAVSPTNTWEENEVISVYYDGTYYQASNAQGGGGKAEKIKYDNSQSGLASQNVQGAVDELGEKAVVINSDNIIGNYTDKLGFITPELVWTSSNNMRKHRAIPVAGADYVKVTAKSDHRSSITFATSDYVTPTASDSGSDVPVCAGAELYYIETADTKIFRIPSDCAYVLVNITSDNSTFLTPDAIYFGVDINKIVTTKITNKIPFATFEHIALRITNNQEYAVQSRNITDYIDISTMSNIIYTRAHSDGAGGDYGMLFYDEDKEPIADSGYSEFINYPKAGYSVEKIPVPEGAIYARFTYWNDERRGKFFVADGDADAEAIALWENTKNTRFLIGFEEGIYRQAIGTSDNGLQLNPLYGFSVYIPVSKGDTVLWHYGDTEIRTMSLCVFDEDGNYVDQRYANTMEKERLIENFMSTSSLSNFLIRASLLIANGSDNYVEVNGVRAWTAFNESLGNKFNKIDNVVEPFENLSFYNKSISTTTGGEADNTKRLSTSFIVHRGRYILSVADGYLIHSVNYYDENKTWYKGIYAPAQTVITEQQEVEGYIKIVITNQDNTTDIALDAPINLTFNTYSGGSLEEFDDALRIGTFNSSYNNTDVEEVRNKYCGLIKGKSKIENFLFFTDPHLTPNSRYEEMTEAIRDKYISTLQKYYNSLPMDLCICGGDWLNLNHPSNTDCEWLGYCDAYMRKLFRNYYPVFGNHDNNPYTPSNTESNWLKALTYPTVMNLMFRENGRTYYSFDGLKTKFYVLNSGVSFIKQMTNSTYSRLVSNRWPQIEWLGNALLQDDAENSVILMHIYSNASNPVNWFSEDTGYRAYGIHDLGKNVKLLVTAYNNRQSITLNGITYNFANCNGRVMFIHCGHTHFDYVDTTGEVPIISTTNLEGGHLVNGEVVYDLIPTFDCCMNDLDNSALYMTRVGAGVSRIVNYSPKALSVGGNISLTSKLSGTITWQTRNSSIATVSNGTVAGVSSGCTGIIATNESGEEEYWIIKVS